MDISQNLKVKDVMTKGVITVPMNTTCKDIAKILAESRVHGVCITDEFGKVVSIVSEIDVIKAFNKDVDKLTAEDLMSDKIVTISGEKYISNAVDIMAKQGIHRLVVVPGDENALLTPLKRPVGILSASDIVKLIAKD